MVSDLISGAIQVRALTRDIALYSWTRYFTLTVPLFTQPGGSGNSPRLKFSLAKIQAWIKLLTLHPNISMISKSTINKSLRRRQAFPTPSLYFYLQSVVYSLQSTLYTDQPGPKPPKGRNREYHMKRTGMLDIPFRARLFESQLVLTQD